MAKLEAVPKMELEVTLTMNESEARFLEGLSGFDQKVILEALRACVGKAYTEGPDHPSAGGWFSLMAACRRDLPGILKRTADAREVFTGRRELSR